MSHLKFFSPHFRRTTLLPLTLNITLNSYFSRIACPKTSFKTPPTRQRRPYLLRAVLRFFTLISSTLKHSKSAHYQFTNSTRLCVKFGWPFNLSFSICNLSFFLPSYVSGRVSSFTSSQNTILQTWPQGRYALKNAPRKCHVSSRYLQTLKNHFSKIASTHQPPYQLSFTRFTGTHPTGESQWRFSLIACILGNCTQMKLHPSFHWRPTGES
jgi:hypothetical protein